MKNVERGSAEWGAGSVAFEALLAAMEGSAKRSLAYGRVADFLSALEVALFASAALAGVAYVLSYAAYWQLAAVATALAVAAFAVDKLSDRYHRRALKELDRLEMLALVAALSVDAGRAKELLKQKVEELKGGPASSN
jgi:MFS family permease